MKPRRPRNSLNSLLEMIGLAIWGLYFFGQTLICVGVTRTLAKNPLG